MIEHSHHTDRDVTAFALPLLRGEETPEIQDRDAERVAEGLRRSGLTALALRRLAGRPAPRALTLALERERNRLRADLALLYDRLAKLADVLADAGVPFILLKGSALAPLLYDSPELRPMVDVDILIHRADWPGARARMAASGYRLPGESVEAYWLANYFNLSIGSPDPRPASFDVHWSLGQEIRYRVDEPGLWDRSVAFTHEGRSYRRLGNEDLLLGLTLHLAYHYFDARLLWLYDLHLLVKKVPIDWRIAAERSRRWGMATVFGLGLAYLEKVFPGSIPAAALVETRSGYARRALLAPLRSPDPGRLFRGDDRRAIQLVQGLLVMDNPLTMIRFSADKVSRRLRFLGRRPRLR
jgi:hypothetical protein